MCRHIPVVSVLITNECISIISTSRRKSITWYALDARSAVLLLTSALGCGTAYNSLYVLLPK